MSAPAATSFFRDVSSERMVNFIADAVNTAIAEVGNVTWSESLIFLEGR